MTEFEIGGGGGGGGGGEDDINTDLDHLFETFLADDLYFLDDANNNNNKTSFPSSPSFVPDPCVSVPDTSLSIVEQMEEFLFNDADDDADHPPLVSAAEGFLSDVLLDSPLPLDSSPSSSAEEEHHKPQQMHQLSSPASLRHEEDEGQVEGNPQNDIDDADPIAKKRKRQLRNRDAAVRSRERKKMYVKDLELKSRYYESECRRLGMLLQCYLAENHALRLSLHNNGLAFDASTTKQESAVLLLESLLLGSLLWFLGIIGLLILPRQSLSIPEATEVENVGDKNRASLVPRKAGSEVFGVLSFMVSKRCRGSRRKMRPYTKAGVKEPGSFDVFSFFLSMTSF